MTKKDYAFIATTLNGCFRYYKDTEELLYFSAVGSAVTKDIIEKLAKRLAKDNPKFDIEKFLSACFKEN